MEQLSEHPVARAVTDSFDGELAGAEDFQSLTGRGVSAQVEGKTIRLGNRRLMEEAGIAVETDVRPLEEQGKTVLLMAVDARLAAVIAVADPGAGHLPGGPGVAAAAGDPYHHGDGG